LVSALTACRRGAAPVNTAPLAVKVSVPIEEMITDTAEYTGRTAAVDSVEVRARVSGYLDKVNFKEGTLVREGEVLFVIDQRTYKAALKQAQAKVTLDEANLKFAEADYQRLLTASKAGATNQQELDKASSARDVAAAQVEADKADVDLRKLNLDFTEVKAPVSGRVGRTIVTVGNLVQSGDQGGGTVLTTLVSVDPMYCYFDVDELTVLRVRKLIREGKAKSARDIKIYVDLALANDEGFPHRGWIDFVNNQIDPKTGTLRLRGVFPNKDETLSPGLFARVRVPIGGQHKALLITDRAIDTDQARKIVYVLDGDNKVAIRPITPGAEYAGLRVVNEGLEASDRVIIEGLQFVRPGATVEPKLVPMPGRKPINAPLVVDAVEKAPQPAPLKD
jgi:RND family efflux transporter MFP subunit